ncbi:MAG: hypothetical protein A3C02_01480 [Candidatus Andersenbacteria bacterium RIFCSPHIGHO2_02_FULL_45_11]|uniref:Uncharacterized protein n=1 Tax=Candidatus Andersenbacteria bacterium RIFCSPHIGHO2_12_FULL_45_11 TaxID=1797281 RepID=A0A1G1X4Y5_9BACT|nr:MAG: hypothetical protein A2805_01210 [Candidatus Andersenbacteria bacterium RIFCSPHIGHO2_01_FULL_46_36]OGY34397.1 MAG: hypothetical protein A3D99_02695 [Candidatus Andersenbacteria bacterium RIFCSPHIGHO2_12_FULL_45_11]OGY34974.1 MAG: hypothetical protein A3C02_01480 [Candidatus Andersenbacteria bacterium RIFCSPHIGHO2_02_FULL_45_11]
MNPIIQRLQSYFASSSQAQEKISDLLLELRHRGLNFSIQFVHDGDEKYFYAESVDYPRGHISATGKNIGELEEQLKDAIFTAFEVPVRYCNSDLITFNPSLTEQSTASASKKIYATT